MTIAFDLDGVFIPDLEFINRDLAQILKFRTNNMQHIFEPKGDYYIITGRPESDLKDTINWIERCFANKPLHVYHGNPHFQNAADYKVSVLNEVSNIDIYIESDIIQVEYIRKYLVRDVKVIHFSEFIQSALNNV